jgi:hypothetical protein
MTGAGARRSPLGDESGFAMIAALLIMVLVTGLASAAMLLSQMDVAVAGNYRTQRAAEVAADGGLELTKSMIFGNEGALKLPLGIPSTSAAAIAWRAGTDTNSDGIGDGVRYPVTAGADRDVSLLIEIKYKQEDNINYNTGETYADEVVRYGQDYNFAMATKVIGKQPVWTATVTDLKTNTKIESDLISTIGFKTPAALYVKGKAHAQNYMYATEETIEVTAGAGTPALGTSATTAATGISLEIVEDTSKVPPATTLTATAVAGATTITVGTTAPTPTTSLAPTTFPAAGTLSIGGETGLGTVTYTGKTATTFTGVTGMPAAPVGTSVTLIIGNTNFAACNSGTNGTTADSSIDYVLGPSYLHQRVYRPSEVVAERNAGRYNKAREMTHMLFGIGSRNADLDTAYASGGAAAADRLFKFYQHCDDNCGSTTCGTGYDNPTAYDNSTTPPTCSGIICYNYTAPIPGTTVGCPAGMTAIECMMGVTFADLKSMADRVLPETVNPPASENDPGGKIACTASSSVAPFTGNTCSLSFTNACDMTGHTLGTAADPKVVFIDGTKTLVTSGAQLNGYGILVINGDADIIGSINWKGLMIVKGKLTHRPCQGGSATTRSGPELSTTWKGFIMIGGDLDLWTYFGGSLILGYSSEEVKEIMDVISNAVPHKILSWRRAYN